MKTKKKSRQEKNQKRLQKIARAHMFFSFTLFLLYIILSCFYSPEFFISDIRNKFSALADSAITITARVLGPPVKPIVTVQSRCINGNFSNLIDWPDDENSMTFDIDRNGFPLISGLSGSQYEDSAINLNTSYTYVVTARGLMGSGIAISDPVSLTTLTECKVQKPAPSLEIISFQAKNLASFGGKVQTSEKRPSFSGITNIPNATIKIYLNSAPAFFSQTTANENGYWSWTCPFALTENSYTIFLTATDPLEVGREAFANLSFEIFKEKNDSDKKTEEKPVIITSPTQSKPPKTQNPPLSEPEKPLESPLDFSLTLGSNVVFQNKELLAKIEIEKLAQKYENQSTEIVYKIFDSQNNELFSFAEQTEIFDNKKFTKNILLPKYLKDGRRKIQVQIKLSDSIISREANFEIKSPPVLSLGGGVMLTYPTILSNLGTISLWLLVLLLFWLFLLSREYWLYLHALRNVTERNLKTLHLISKVKKRKTAK